MSFGNLLGGLLQNGLGVQGRTQQRVDTTAQSLGSSGGGAQDILATLQGALAGRTGGGAAGPGFGGLAERARQFLGKDQVGGFSGAQIGGAGAAAGALLGGGIGGAARGGALALLGTLAVTALRRAEAERGGQTQPAALTVQPHEVEAVTSPDTERLLLRAMISAAKADGNVDREEMRKIMGKVEGDGVTAEEKAFVMDELNAPLDVRALAAEVTSPAQAAEVYAISLLAIDLDTEDERSYLRDLATALRLDDATTGQLHQMTGVPRV